MLERQMDAVGSALAAVRPSARQLLWQSREMYSFVHFGMNTVTGREWGAGDEDPARFDPARMDADQWMRGFVSAGMTGVILTAKHHDGFCLWDSALTDYKSTRTPFGRDVVARMDRLRILVDLSHCGTRTTLEGIRAAARPVSVTHSGCNAIFRHPRNKDDEALRLLAERGGVVGVYLMPFLNAEGPPSPDDVLAHLEHALQVCGEDHVGIGEQEPIPVRLTGRHVHGVGLSEPALG